MLPARSHPSPVCTILLSLVFASCLCSCSGVACFSFSSNLGIGSPFINTVTPNAVAAGGAQIQITIIGGNFNNNAVLILPNGTQLVPISLTGSQMIVLVPANVIATPGTLVIRVSNPCGTLSNPFAVAVIVI